MPVKSKQTQPQNKTQNQTQTQTTKTQTTSQKPAQTQTTTQTPAMPKIPVDQIVQRQTRRTNGGPKKAGVLFSPGEKGYEIILAMKAEGLNIKRTVEQLLIWFWSEYQKQKQSK